jgi:hypothetical protein
MSDFLAILRGGAVLAAAKHAARQDRAERAIAHIARKRDAYLAAACALQPLDPLKVRALSLADCCGWRMLAWQALAAGETEQAERYRVRAAFSFRHALAVMVQ